MPRLGQLIEELVTANPHSRPVKVWWIPSATSACGIRTTRSATLLSRSRRAPIVSRGATSWSSTLDGTPVDPRGRGAISRAIHPRRALRGATGYHVGRAQSHSESVIPFGVTGNKIKPIFPHGSIDRVRRAGSGTRTTVFGDTALAGREHGDGAAILAKRIGDSATGAHAWSRCNGGRQGYPASRLYFGSIWRSMRGCKSRRWTWGEIKFPDGRRSGQSFAGRTGSYGINRAWENWCRASGAAPSRQMRDEAPRRTMRRCKETAAVVGTCYRRARGAQRGEAREHGGPKRKWLPCSLKRVYAGEPKIAAADPMLVVEDIVKRFETPDGVLIAVDHVSLSNRAGRVRRRDRSLWLRENRPYSTSSAACLDGYDGTVTVAGERVRGPHPAIGMDIPGGIHLPLAQT